MVIQELYSRPNFNNVNLGLLDNVEFKKVFDVGPWRNLRTYNPATNGPSMITVDGVRSLGHFFKKGYWGSETGMNQIMRISSQTETEVWWGFNFKFEAGFLYSITGKFYGLSVGPLGTPAGGSLAGGRGPASNLIAINGLTSVRLAPMETPSGIRFQLYIYDYRMTGVYGRSSGGQFGQINPGEWQQVVVRTVINPDKNVGNGICQVWLDGSLVLSVNDLWLTHPQVTHNYFSEFTIGTFMGGASTQFASKQDQYIYQRDVHIWKVTSGGVGHQFYSPSAEIVTPMGIINDSGGTPPEPDVPPQNPPLGTISGNISTTTNSAIINFTYSAADSTGFQYRLNGGTILTAVSPISLTSLTPATSYTVEIRAINNNGSGSWFSFSFSTQSIVSNQPPITISTGNKKTKHRIASSPENTQFDYDLDFDLN